MDEIAACISSLGFSRLETQIYVILLYGGEMTPNQIAHELKIPAKEVLKVLSHLCTRGAVLCSAQNCAYTAQNPDILFPCLSDEYYKNAECVAAKLRSVYKNNYNECFTNIKGFETVAANAKKLLLTAQKEVYMDTDFDLHIFAPEFSAIRQKGVRIIVFSYSALSNAGLDIELYTHGTPAHDGDTPTKIILSADLSAALAAGINEKSKEWTGSVTNSRQAVMLMAEHIHNCIYMLKLKEKYGDDFINGLKINTGFEKEYV